MLLVYNTKAYLTINFPKKILILIEMPETDVLNEFHPNPFSGIGNGFGP